MCTLNPHVHFSTSYVHYMYLHIYGFLELPSPEGEAVFESLESVKEVVEDDPSSSESSSAQKKTSPSLFKRRRATDQHRMSSVIKLDYDLSDPVYPLVKDLILRYVLMWVLPSNSQQRGYGMSGSPAPSPLVPRRPKFVPSGVELMRDMWFTSRDNVSMLLEICRQGFQTPLLQTYTLRKLVELYFYWEQVRLINKVVQMYILHLLPLSLSLSLSLPHPFPHTHSHSLPKSLCSCSSALCVV